MWYFCMPVSGDSGLLGHDTLLLGQWSLTFERTAFILKRLDIEGRGMVGNIQHCRIIFKKTWIVSLKAVSPVISKLWVLHPVVCTCNGIFYWTVITQQCGVMFTQGATERTPLFEKRINSKPKKIRQMFFYSWKAHRMPFYINVFWTKHHSIGGLEYWYTDVASLGSCLWPWESFQV